MEKKRQYWIDVVKFFACILVAIGHLLQSLVTAGIMPETQGYVLFNQSIYSFHVPLFFICSGFLYQSFSKVNSFASWKANVIKKWISLGVPYVVFVFATWLMKKIFSSDVNTPVGGLVDCLFVHPLMQYWYLYCLMFLFLLVPTVGSRRSACVLLALATVVKCLSFFISTNIAAVSYVSQYAFWFVLGMFFSVVCFNEMFKRKSSLLYGLGWLAIFVALVALFAENWTTAIDFIGGLAACFAAILLIGHWIERISKTAWIRFSARYTMPIYLMHSIFAAAGRAVLLRIGISDMWVHVVAGMILSFGAPIIAGEIILRTKWLSWMLVPLLSLNVKNGTQLTEK